MFATLNSFSDTFKEPEGQNSTGKPVDECGFTREGISK
jgi:hypothetical protein